MGKKLLVADDSVTIQKVIKLALSSEGYDILAVSDGQEAIRAIQEERPDVVVIDVALPGADAYEVKRAINEDPDLASHVSFILMASAFERVDEKKAEEAAFDARLIKPFDPAHLRKAVKAGKKVGVPTPSVPKQEPSPQPESGREEMSEINIDPASPMAPVLPTEINKDDLPPLTDMHSIVTEIPQGPIVTEEEFQLHGNSDVGTVEVTPQPSPPPFSGVDELQSESDTEAEEEQSAQRALENDIKGLTESTIKMSGLDDFQWNLDDSRKMKAPPSSPPPAPVEVSAEDDEVTRPIPINRMVSPPLHPLDDGGSNFPLHTPPSADAPAVPPPGSGLISGADYVAPTVDIDTNKSQEAAVGVSGASVVLPITRAEIEQIIHKDIESAIEKIARDTVSQIAESVIRAEIEKILSE